MNYVQGALKCSMQKNFDEYGQSWKREMIYGSRTQAVGRKEKKDRPKWKKREGKIQRYSHLSYKDPIILWSERWKEALSCKITLRWLVIIPVPRVFPLRPSSLSSFLLLSLFLPIILFDMYKYSCTRPWRKWATLTDRKTEKNEKGTCSTHQQVQQKLYNNEKTTLGYKSFPTVANSCGTSGKFFQHVNQSPPKFRSIFLNLEQHIY